MSYIAAEHGAPRYHHRGDESTPGGRPRVDPRCGQASDRRQVSRTKMPETMGWPCGYTNCRGPGTPLERRLTWGHRAIKVIGRKPMRIVEVIHGRRLGGGSSCALGRRVRAAL